MSEESNKLNTNRKRQTYVGKNNQLSYEVGLKTMHGKCNGRVIQWRWFESTF